jgi:hypothetical protein
MPPIVSIIKPNEMDLSPNISPPKRHATIVDKMVMANVLQNPSEKMPAPLTAKHMGIVVDQTI